MSSCNPDTQQRVKDDSYKTQGNKPIPVQGDDYANVESPYKPETADSDKQLEQDDKEAIDQANVVKERTRQAKPATGTYQEPSETAGL